jgi:hypothetical protein
MACATDPLKSVLVKSIYCIGLSTFHSLADNNSKLSLGYYFIPTSQYVSSFIFVVPNSICNIIRLYSSLIYSCIFLSQEIHFSGFLFYYFYMICIKRRLAIATVCKLKYNNEIEKSFKIQPGYVMYDRVTKTTHCTPSNPRVAS